ncbi:MAG TPA: hypothetical protein VG938_05865 [Verrucomicrobiae bacterium]|jgi:hypothetical protein|nr:hypothetical protein [Verrucomicrobiae bacterium]
MSDVPASNNMNHASPGHAATKKVAVVQCEGFRCLAYQDPATGIWHDVQTGAELPGVKDVVFEFAV